MYLASRSGCMASKAYCALAANPTAEPCSVYSLRLSYTCTGTTSLKLSRHTMGATAPVQQLHNAVTA